MRGFSAKVEDEAEVRAAGRCENKSCGGMLKPGKYHFDHIKPHAQGGDNSLENCQLLCVKCHLQKTLDDDMPPIRAADKKGKRSEDVLKAQRQIGKSEIGRRFQ